MWPWWTMCLVPRHAKWQPLWAIQDLVTMSHVIRVISVRRSTGIAPWFAGPFALKIIKKSVVPFLEVSIFGGKVIFGGIHFWLESYRNYPSQNVLSKTACLSPTGTGDQNKNLNSTILFWNVRSISFPFRLWLWSVTIMPNNCLHNYFGSIKSQALLLIDVFSYSCVEILHGFHTVKKISVHSAAKMTYK